MHSDPPAKAITKDMFTLVTDYQAAERRLLHRCDLLQRAVDTAFDALNESQYVGGPDEREAYRAAMEALTEVATQHQGTDAKP